MPKVTPCMDPYTVFKLQESAKSELTWRVQGETESPSHPQHPDNEGMKGPGRIPTCVSGETKEAMQRKLLKVSSQGHGPEKSEKGFYLYHR